MVPFTLSVDLYESFAAGSGFWSAQLTTWPLNFVEAQAVREERARSEQVAKRIVEVRMPAAYAIYRW
jgi:hypothetical protein